MVSDLAFASAYCSGVSDFLFSLFAFLVAALLFFLALVLSKIPIHRSLFISHSLAVCHTIRPLFFSFLLYFGTALLCFQDTHYHSLF
jgi:hypothetical protein